MNTLKILFASLLLPVVLHAPYQPIRAPIVTHAGSAASMMARDSLAGGVVLRRRFNPPLPAQLWRVSELDAPEPGNTLTPVNAHGDPVAALCEVAGSTCLWGEGRTGAPARATAPYGGLHSLRCEACQYVGLTSLRTSGPHAPRRVRQQTVTSPS